MPDQSYLRCRHCRGFYESDRAQCKWCDYETPFLDQAGKPRLFPDRQTCRAVQLAEFEQLPPEAHADCMGPPKEELTLLCNCLHCGPEGHTFEAIEMRWIVSERMWACPCTTCGGRGFSIDIHSAEDKWQCAECGHFYTPKDNDYRPANAKCPKCGCTQASGWFDDEFDEEAFIAEELAKHPPADPAEPLLEGDDSLPWDDDDDPASPQGEFDLGLSWRESDDDDFEVTEDGRLKMPDDIDFPTFRDKNDDLNEGDIPF